MYWGNRHHLFPPLTASWHQDWIQNQGGVSEMLLDLPSCGIFMAMKS